MERAKSFEVLNPCDLSVIETLNFHSDEYIESAIVEASEALVVDIRDGLQLRIDAFRRVALLLSQRQEEFVQVMISEGGKPRKDSLVEFKRALQGIEAAIGELYQFGGREVPMSLSASSAAHRAYTRRVPIGVNLAISAFNHPLNLMIHQVVAPILAGCPVLVKPALKTPLSAMKFVSLLHEAGISKAQLKLILLPDSKMSELVADGRFALVNFIGSSAVGQKIQRLVSTHTEVVLEHGGNAPLILTPSAKWKERVESIARSAFAHAGQVCVSLQNVFVHESLASEFTQALIKCTESLVVGNSSEERTDIGPMIRPEARARVLRVLDGLDESEILLAAKQMDQTFLTPTIARPKSWHNPVVIDEIFGPVLNLLTYREASEVTSFLRDSRYAFQGAVWSQDISEIHFFERHLKLQTLMVNELPSFRVDWMPFGGFNDSGRGLGGFRATYEVVTREIMTLTRF